MQAKKILSSKKLKTLILFSLCVIFYPFSYGQSSVEAIKTDTLHRKVNKPPQLRIGAQKGFGYRTAPIPSNNYPTVKNHLKKLKNNRSYGADISYYFTKNCQSCKIRPDIGIGAKYNVINASASTTKMPITVENKTIYVPLSEKVKIHYIGGFIAARQFVTPNNRHCFLVNVGSGYLMYKNNLKINAKKEDVKGETATFFTKIGYDFLATKYIAIGIQVSMAVGWLSAVNFTTGKRIVFDKNQREDVSHIDISLGLRFYK